MHLEIEAFFEHQTALIKARDADALSELCKAPLPVFHSDDLKLNANRAQIHQKMELLCEAIAKLQATDIRCRILDVTARPGTDTVSALVEYQYRRSTELLRFSRIRYFLEHSKTGTLITLVEYLNAGFPEVLAEASS